MPFIMDRDETDSQQTAECLLVFLPPSIFLEEEISALRVQYVTVPIPPNDKINNRLNKEAFALISLR